MPHQIDLPALLRVKMWWEKRSGKEGKRDQRRERADRVSGVTVLQEESWVEDDGGGYALSSNTHTQTPTPKNIQYSSPVRHSCNEVLSPTENTCFLHHCVCLPFYSLCNWEYLTEKVCFLIRMQTSTNTHAPCPFWSDESCHCIRCHSSFIFN